MLCRYAELPKIDERYVGLEHKIGYIAMLDPEFPPGPVPFQGSFNCVGRFDFETRKVRNGSDSFLLIVDTEQLGSGVFRVAFGLSLEWFPTLIFVLTSLHGY